MEILTKKKTMRVCVGGVGTIPIYKDVEVLENYKRLVLAQHPDGQAGIYLDEGTDVLQASRYNFGETGTPPREIRTANETEARAKWDSIIDDLKLRDAEEEQRQNAMEAMRLARESAAAIRDLRVKKIVTQKNEAIADLKEYLKKPGIDLFGKKSYELTDQVVRCETLLKYI